MDIYHITQLSKDRFRTQNQNPQILAYLILQASGFSKMLSQLFGQTSSSSLQMVRRRLEKKVASQRNVREQ